MSQRAKRYYTQDRPATYTPPQGTDERSKIIARLRCIAGGRFTSARGIEGIIRWDGLERADGTALVPFLGEDPKTKLPHCSIETIREVTRENEAHIRYRDEGTMSAIEFFDKHPELRAKRKAFLKMAGIQTEPAGKEEPARPVKKHRDPIIEELDVPTPDTLADTNAIPEGFPGPERIPEDEEIPF